MKYLPLFRIQVQHGYYNTNPCKDLRIVPTAETKKLLARYRLLLKEQTNGIVVLAGTGADDKTLFLSIDDKELFAFGLKISNANYILTTDLSLFEGKSIPTYTNFVTGEAETQTLQLTDRQSASAEIAGAFRKREILAAIELQIDASMNDLSIAREPYRIKLQARSAYWAYYLISDQMTDFNLIDADNKLTFNEADITLVRDSDPVAEELSKKYPEATYKRLRFLSESPVPCSIKPRTAIELHRKENNRDEKIFSAMPNPSIRRTGILQNKDVLYQIIEHNTKQN
jgi:hypothetical protein